MHRAITNQSLFLFISLSYFHAAKVGRWYFNTETAQCGSRFTSVTFLFPKEGLAEGIIQGLVKNEAGESRDSLVFPAFACFIRLVAGLGANSLLAPRAFYQTPDMLVEAVGLHELLEGDVHPIPPIVVRVGRDVDALCLGIRTFDAVIQRKPVL